MGGIGCRIGLIARVGEAWTAQKKGTLTWRLYSIGGDKRDYHKGVEFSAQGDGVAGVYRKGRRRIIKVQAEGGECTMRSGRCI